MCVHVTKYIYFFIHFDIKYMINIFSDIHKVDLLICIKPHSNCYCYIALRLQQSQQSAVIFFNQNQGGDLATGTQALPVGKIIDDKVCRKDNQKGIANLHIC